MTSTLRLFLIFGVGCLGLTLGSCAAFEFRPLCDVESDCDGASSCQEGICVDLEDLDPESFEPDTNEPSFFEPGTFEPDSAEPDFFEPDPPEPANPPEPSADPTPEPDPSGCAIEDCGCDPVVEFGMPNSTQPYACTNPIGASDASEHCQSLGSRPLTFAPDDWSIVSEALQQMTAPLVWTGLMRAGSTITTDTGDTYESDDYPFALPPLAPSEGCVAVDPNAGLVVVDCSTPLPFACGDFLGAGAGNDCPDVNVMSDPNNCGGCNIECPGFACEDGYCRPTTRATDIEQLDTVAATPSTYWTLRRQEPAEATAYRLPVVRGQSAVNLGTESLATIRSATTLGETVFVLTDVNEMFGTAALSALSTQAGSPNASALALIDDLEPTDNEHIPLAVTSEKWFVGNGRTLKFGDLSDELALSVTVAPEGDHIATLAVANGYVFVSFAGSTDLAILRTVDAEHLNVPVAAHPGLHTHVYANTDRIAYASEVNGGLSVVSTATGPELEDQDLVTWTAAQHNLTIPIQRLRDIVIIDDEAYVLVVTEANIHAVVSIALDRSAPAQVVVPAEVAAIDTVSGVLVWLSDDGSLHEMIPPRFP